MPVFKRAGLGSILGYLAAGLVIGPFGLRIFSDPEAILLGRPNAVYSKDSPAQTPQAQAGAGFVVR